MYIFNCVDIPFLYFNIQIKNISRFLWCYTFSTSVDPSIKRTIFVAYLLWIQYLFYYLKDRHVLVMKISLHNVFLHVWANYVWYIFPVGMMFVLLFPKWLYNLYDNVTAWFFLNFTALRSHRISLHEIFTFRESTNLDVFVVVKVWNLFILTHYFNIYKWQNVFKTSFYLICVNSKYIYKYKFVFVFGNSTIGLVYF